VTDYARIEDLKQAIAALEAQRELLGDAVVDASTAAMRKELAGLQPATEQQRKQATILFTDIVGSTTLFSQFDPEEELRIVDQALGIMRSPVLAHGGRTVRMQGDGFKAIFGNPIAHESDPEMAVRAGLHICQAAREFGRHLEAEQGLKGFDVRVGIATGLVLIGGESEGQDTVKGRPVNLAARLESAAPAGGVLIAANTLELVRGLFEVETQRPVQAKGFDQPVMNYLVTSRLAALAHDPTRTLTPMVNRVEELELLTTAFDRTVNSNSREMITVIAEAGVGKSRLLQEFEAWLSNSSGESVWIFHGRGREETQAIPYGLFGHGFALKFGILDSDSPETVFQKMEQGVAQVLGEAEDSALRAHFIGQLCGFDFSASPFLEGVQADTRQMRDRSRRYLAEFVQAAAQQQPVVLFMDDLHWSDDNSRDTIIQLASSLVDLPVLIICNTRPRLLQEHPEWAQNISGHRRLDLAPLNREDSRSLISAILSQNEAHAIEQIPMVLREMVVSSTEGNPFYIEALLRMLQEKGLIAIRDGALEIDQEALLRAEVPASLTSVLQARLDSLPGVERMILQQASVVGRTFWDELLLKINVSDSESDDHHEVQTALDQLITKEMIIRKQHSAFSDSAEFDFRHNLLREATYESVLLRHRQNYHGLVADWLINRSGDRAQEFSGLIGDHLDRAGRSEEAVDHLRDAGSQAVKRYANLDALVYLSRALELTGEEALQRQFDIRAAREQVYSLLGSRDAQTEELAALGGLAEQIRNPQCRGHVARLNAAHARAISDYQGIMVYAQQTIDYGKEAGDDGLAAEGELLFGLAQLSMGSYPEAKEKFQHSLKGAQETEMDQLEGESLRNLGIVFQRTGMPVQAVEHYDAALEIFREIGDRRGEGSTLNQLGNISLLQGERESAQRYYDDYRQISQEIGDLWGQGIVIQAMGDISMGEANPGAASQQYQAALATAREVKNQTMEGGALVGLGQASLEKSEFTQALEYFQSSLGLARSIGNRPMEGKSLNEIGTFFRRLGDFVRARSYFEQALQLFVEMGNRTSRARSMVNLSELANQLGDSESAEELAVQALDILADVSLRDLEAQALIQLGEARGGGGDWQAAAGIFEQALELLEAIDHQAIAPEARTAIGWARLQQGQVEEAYQAINLLMMQLGAQGFKTQVDEGRIASSQISLQVYWRCYNILQAKNDSRADRLIDAARSMIETQANQIGDIELRLNFLHIPAHNAIQNYQDA
jgi:class 3 adenylate cyclase/tetratricopeptide (TPR) repeat protein